MNLKGNKRPLALLGFPFISKENKAPFIYTGKKRDVMVTRKWKVGTHLVIFISVFDVLSYETNRS